MEAIVGCSRQQIRVASPGTNTPVGDVSSLMIITDGGHAALRVTMGIENPAVAEFVGVTPSGGCTVEPAQLLCELTGAATLGVDVHVSGVGSTIVFIDISADGGPPLGTDVTIGSDVNRSPPRPFMVTGEVPMATRGDYEGTLVTEAQTPLPDLLGSAFLVPTDASYGPVTIAPTGTVTRVPDGSVTFDFAQDPSGTVTEVELAFTVSIPSAPPVQHDHNLEVQLNGSAPITLHASTSIVSNEVSIVASDATATEAGPTTGAFTVSRDGDTGQPLTVFYRIGGTATPGVDYVRLPGSVTIPAGMPTTSIIVTPKNDALVEPSETVLLTLAARPAYTVGAASSATVEIMSSDVVTVVPANATATEAGRTAGTFTVRRSLASGAPSAPLIVSYTVAGTATPGSDYARLPGTITIPAGALSANIPVTPADDALMEGPETVVLRLLATPAYAVGTPNSATVNIASNEVVTVAATDATASEVGRTTGTFRVSRTGNAAAPLTVVYTLGGTARRGSDYTAPLSVVIPAGALSANVTVTPIDDGPTGEGTETVVLTLSPQSTYTVGPARTATVNITRASSAPVVTVVATDSTATEAGRTTGTFTVRRTGSTTAPLIVFYTATGTATPGSDYATLPGRVTIPLGAPSATIAVTPTDDPLMEGTETVVLTLAPQTAYTVGAPGSATVNIASNEVVTVVAMDPTATEAGNTTGSFIVRRTGLPAGPLTVFYALTGTAVRGADYVITPAPFGSVTIPPGAMSATVTVTPINDTQAEGVENVVLALIPRPTSYTVGSPSIATVNITSNE